MANPRDDPHQRRRASRSAGAPTRLWPTYLGFTGLLLLILVALAGGIIWYNSVKSNELAVAAASRLMREAEDKIIDRIELLYDPMYAIVGIASLVPQLTSPTIGSDPHAMALGLRALRFYPQIQSLYVGFTDGEFYMMTHFTGKKSAALRAALGAPRAAAFAVEIIRGSGGGRTAEWSFLSEDGAVLERRAPVPTSFDPRRRPWYIAAEHSDLVEESGLYIFASSRQPGFTLSRRFEGPTPGVMGADLAATDLSEFLSKQKVTPTSAAFIFTENGRVVATPNPTLLTARPVSAGQTTLALPSIADLHDPAIGRLVAAYQIGRMEGTRFYNVGDRRYVGRVIAIPPRYGRNQLLGIAVPVDEIEKPIESIRYQTLLYSIAFLVFALPLYVTLVVAWIDRRLARPTDDE
jgi:adenylate cyclase